MGFSEDFAAAAGGLLQEQFGETVIYRPASGAPRSIVALWIDRDVESIDGIPRGVAITFRLEVKNSATIGITREEAKAGAGRDKIDISDVEHGTVLVTRTIRRLVVSETGGVVIEAD